MGFKKHMILFADNEGFTTFCGIDDGCSEDFWDDPNNLVKFGNKDETTCKRCLNKWAKAEAEYEKQMALLGEQVKDLTPAPADK